MNSEVNQEQFRSLGGKIKEEEAGVRVDAHLAKHFPFFSRNIWARRIQLGELLVSGQKVRASAKLKEGDRLHFFHPEEKEPEVDANLKVLFEDDGVMCVFKPAGLPMHEGGPYRLNTFYRYLRDLVGEEWAAVHRLDRETSGIVLCGNNVSIRDRLAQDFRFKKMKKEYLALVEGIPETDGWDVDAPIDDLQESEIRIKKWVVEGGQDAFTTFKIEKKFDQRCLLRAFPKTGRTNQIRIHAAYSGFRLVGDKLYHPDERVFLEHYEKGHTEFVAKAVGHHRCCLHAAVLEFKHPISGKNIRVESPLPDDMADLC